MKIRTAVLISNGCLDDGSIFFPNALALEVIRDIGSPSPSVNDLRVVYSRLLFSRVVSYFLITYVMTSTGVETWTMKNLPKDAMLHRRE